MQIIVGAILLGIVAFLGIAVSLRTQPQFQQQPAGVPILTYTSAAFTLMMLVLQAVFPGMVATASRRKLATATPPSSANAGLELSPEVIGLCGIYQTRLIIAAALIEGGAFFCLISYLVEGQWPSLAIAVFCVVVIASKFPTRGRLERWLEAQQEVLQYERSLQ
jgi:nitric oxide reductase large subunit